ncbi:nervous system development [Seminavis robusta]|uniref:Nervous system development n=1 Tax=Seminavis robusta TaxID=568900 RepID=A0A9N8F5Q7_9STRA|nr:nervous system development [Seminavis robusta]|eukprot:Sro3533_g349030.1 nervous system development (397) ;mRNA; r:4513-5703
MSSSARKRQKASGDIYRRKTKAARKGECPPAKDGNAELKWRGDPDKTYSDWKIEIVSNEEEEAGSSQKVDTYHVHKVTLACGTRKSEYFDRLFQNGDKFQEGVQSISCIELHALAAKAFPDMLDYVYDPRRTLDISIGTAVSLYHLGEYFEIHPLQCDALEFIKKVDPAICHIMVQHAMIFHNDTIIEAVGELLSEEICEIKPYYKIVSDVFFPPLWLHMSKSMDKRYERVRKCLRSYYFQILSSLIAIFVKCHKNALDTATFEELTSEKNMPFFHADSSLLFLEVEEFIRKKEGKEVVVEGTVLGKRCARAIAAGDYHSDCTSEKESLWKILNAHPDMLKEVFFDTRKNFVECKLAFARSQQDYIKVTVPLPHQPIHSKSQRTAESAVGASTAAL